MSAVFRFGLPVSDLKSTKNQLNNAQLLSCNIELFFFDLE